MHRSSEESDPWAEELADIRERNLFRSMPPVSGGPGRIIEINGREVLNFSSNNYLGLAGHPTVVKAAAESALRHGAGATASRLIAGNTEAHRELESFIAQWKGVEAALFFGSGYQANVGILSSVVQKGDLILSDSLNHASIIDGCRLSRAQVEIYPHFDLNGLEDLLRLQGFRRKLVVTESVFSMDGDHARLDDLDNLCKRHGAMLMVDEAHAAGIHGPQGQGLAAELGVVPEIQMGTLSKAVGTYGAYVAGRRSLIELLVNRARSFIYTTAPPPAVAGAALAALKIIASDEGLLRRKRLKENMKNFADLLNTPDAQSSTAGHIVPIVIGDSARTLAVSRACLEEGVFAQGIRFPTVPEDTARLRFTLMSDHLTADLEQAATVVKKALHHVRS